MKTFRIKDQFSSQVSHIFAHDFPTKNVIVEVLDHLNLGPHGHPTVMDPSLYFVSVLDHPMIQITFTVSNPLGLDCEVVLSRGEDVPPPGIPIIIGEKNFPTAVEYLLKQLPLEILQSHYKDWDKLKIKLEQLILNRN